MNRGRNNHFTFDAVWNRPDDSSSDESSDYNKQNKTPRSISSTANSSTSRITTNRPNFKKRSDHHERTRESGNVDVEDSTQKRFYSQSNDQGRKSDNHAKKYLNENKQRANVRPNVKREIRPMSFQAISHLYEKEDPNEILLIILNRDSGFSRILEQRDIRRDVMAYVLLAAGKALASYMRININAMLTNMTSVNTTFFKNLTAFLASFQKYPSQRYHLDSLVGLSEILLKFQLAMPSTASDPLIEILPLLEKTCKMFLNSSTELHQKVFKNIQEIEERNSHFLQGYNPKKAEQASRKEKLQLQTPPEDYRSIPVLPTVDDIHSPCSFLRPNLVRGQYQNTDHYLDVQYRLLREDYVKPLRDGIAEYLILKKQGKPFKHCKDVRVYQDVHIIKQDFVYGGLVHFAHFSDKNFAKIKWEYSKRFLTGSLLCLSSDDFETMLFASVARRETKDLEKGLLLLRFEELTDEVLTLSPLRNFVVIETNSYFEAYRHNLVALLELEESSLAMKPYIVDVQKNVQIPKYLHQTVAYDMRPLLIPLDNKYINHAADYDGKVITSYDFPAEISQKARAVQILKDDHWPSCAELSLDPSQYAAIKAAVTKEFTIIQGPPGTGKTFVGLRIAQLLLHNMDKWRSSTNPSPILVVCYTNHALDQFLEGLLLFTQQIVRVGGRGTNEALLKFQLNNLKRIIEEKREVPLYMFKNIRQKRFELRNLTEDIGEAKQSMEKCYSFVLGEYVLRDCISEEHYHSLKNVCGLEDDGFNIHDWLGIRVRTGNEFHGQVSGENYEEVPADLKTDGSANPGIPASKENDDDGKEEDSEGEADIEFIEAQRDINSEDFAGVSCDVPVNESEEFFPEVESGGWQFQGSKKKRTRLIMNYLKNTKAMTEVELKNIKNIWDLPPINRWRLYKFWLESHIAERQKEVFELQKRLRKEFEELSEIQTEIDLHICLKAHVVGMTTTGAAKYRNIVQHLNPKIVIVEEAAEILESHIVTSLAPDTQHVILIGDHQQLKPNPTVYALAVQYDLNVSLFERMVQNGMECYRLDIQHRMRPEIAALIVPHIYKDLKNHESVLQYEDIKGVSKNVFFISHNYNELQEFDSKSKVNQHEATFLIRLCRYILLQGYEPSQITVLTTYLGQLFALKKLVGEGLLKSVKFTVVDNYQGEENDIILISFVRSNEEGEIGFLKISNRVCVALSRAKKGLYCIGNFEMLMQKSPLWKNIISVLQENQAVGPSLQLSCQNHPAVNNVVANDRDFDAVREGGCTRNCEFRLSCGHVCSLICHPYDMEHLTIKCYKPCTKTCENGHRCKRSCSEDCGHCTELVTKKLDSCGHVIKVMCHRKNSDVHCTKPCENVLSCGHKCVNTCNVACVMNCKESVEIVSPLCGHKILVQCCNSSDLEYFSKVCNAPCRVELSCGHTCRGTCSRCHQGRLHVLCNQPCKRILVCGHQCKSPCSKSCPPCRRPCENRCFHSKCPKKCGEPCEKCTEPCEWHCPHKKCTRLCGEPCDRTACNEPCPKILKCKHPCIGLCGEPCPKECRICDKDIVTDIFFGMEDEEDARFIYLEDCKHIIERTCLTQWMNQSVQGNQEIQMPVCPKCKVVVRRNLRFGNIVKSCLADIEKVKKVTYGDAKENLKMQISLLQEAESKSSYVKFVCQPLLRILMSPKSRSKVEITVMENIISLADSLDRATDFLNGAIYSKAFTDLTVQASYHKLERYMKSSKELLVDFLQNEYLTASEHQLQDLNWEIHRLKLADQLLRFLNQRTSIKANSHLTNLMESLVSYGPFLESDANKCRTEIEALFQLGEAVINISDLDRKTILKAMGLSKGHWYQCPNGHVYCITECGGAVQESRCNECGATIGGSNHALLPTNRVSTAMDGARYSAFSDAANLENYRF